MMLPPCPLRLRSSFVWKYLLGGTALVLVAIAAVVGFAIWQYDDSKALLDQDRIWQTGVPALRTEVGGKVTSRKFVFHEYELDVHFLDANQVEHEGKVGFDTIGAEVDQKVEPVVRYLKDDPSRFALSWAMEVKTSRWCSIGFMVLAGVGLIGGSFGLLGCKAFQRLSDARRCARRSDEILLRITNVTQQLVNGKHKTTTYEYAGQTIDGRAVTGKADFPAKHEPLFADGARQSLLALVAQENLKRAVVLRDDFYPFDLAADDQAKVRSAIAARVGKV